jgi:hypothetical protein
MLETKYTAVMGQKKYVMIEIGAALFTVREISFFVVNSPELK